MTRQDLDVVSPSKMDEPASRRDHFPMSCVEGKVVRLTVFVLDIFSIYLKPGSYS